MMTEHILLVEDNPRDVEITLDLVAEGRPDAVVTVVHNGEEALDFLHRRGDFRLRGAGEPSLILLDVKMPKIGGIELLARLRSQPATANIPVVMLSSSRQEKDLMEAHELQADGYLIKPAKPEQLVKTIDTALKARNPGTERAHGSS